MHQPRDENGRYVSLDKLFERERLDHQKDHEQERQVAKDTAQRLEREVEQTAVRLQRAVEENALRLEKGVETALHAVTATATVHAEAHAREHLAHERIHLVEKDQLEKAEGARQREADVLSEHFREFKETSNEWRGTLRDQAGGLVTRTMFEVEHERIINLEKRLAYYAGAAAVGGALSGALIAYIVRIATGA